MGPLTWVFECCCRSELWFPFVRDGPVLKEIEAPFLHRLENSTSSHHGCHLDTSGSFHSVRNLPKQKRPTPAWVCSLIPWMCFLLLRLHRTVLLVCLLPVFNVASDCCRSAMPVNHRIIATELHLWSSNVGVCSH